MNVFYDHVIFSLSLYSNQPISLRSNKLQEKKSQVNDENQAPFPAQSVHTLPSYRNTFQPRPKSLLPSSHKRPQNNNNNNIPRSKKRGRVMTSSIRPPSPRPSKAPHPASAAAISASPSCRAGRCWKCRRHRCCCRPRARLPNRARCPTTRRWPSPREAPQRGASKVALSSAARRY